MLIIIKDLEMVLHVPEPWYIDPYIFDQKLKQLDVYLKFPECAVFICSGCKADVQPEYDIADYELIWRNLNFAEYPICFHSAHPPRKGCTTCNRILRIDIPRTIKLHSGFTKLFDAWIMIMAKDMPMNAISRLMQETDKRLWRILHYYVDNAIAVQVLSHVTQISIDETSAKRGDNYITIFKDPRQRNVICFTRGKDSTTWGVCKEHLESHGGRC